MGNLVEVRDLSVGFVEGRGPLAARVDALSRVSFRVEEGQCFGVVGPKGSGKSTLLRALSCLVPVTSGEVFIRDFSSKINEKEIRRCVGLVPQTDCFDTDFNVFDNLVLFARYYGIPYRKAHVRARELLKLTELEDKDHLPVTSLPPEALKSLSLARALMPEPTLLLLDEPTIGLDIVSAKAILQLLTHLKQQFNLTFIFASSNMSEAERLCDRVAIFDRGTIVREGSPKELVLGCVGNEIVEFDVNRKDLEYFINRVRGRYQYQICKDKLKLFIPEGSYARDALDLVTSESVVLRRASLDDVLTRLVGEVA